MPPYSKTSRPSQVNRDGARLWQGAHHFTMGNVHTVVADNYHYHSHGQDNRVFESTMLAAGVALLAFIAYVLSNLYECICK
ncbi:hypothetical protein D9611_006609 [Ephemerocybe angulata]|uniref:Uncharacterized protein n=1 Tax=Ephemerocybe angulata TaxID=980116 RepID=A0A8H5C790_9AGAR|nr:hypothetical protein D9611_006609 [Tulosesus angulatus]